MASGIEFCTVNYYLCIGEVFEIIRKVSFNVFRLNPDSHRAQECVQVVGPRTDNAAYSRDVNVETVCQVLLL